MVRVRKHVEGVGDLGAVAESAEYSDIPRLGLGIAGDVDDPFRTQPCQSVQERRGTARAGRVDEGGVDRRALFGKCFHVIPAVGGGETDIFDAVQLRVEPCVADRLRVQLDGEYLLRVPRGDDADGADSAVGVQHGLGAAEFAKLDRLAVQLFGLGMIDLVERGGGDEEALSAQHVGDMPFSEQHARCLAVEELASVTVDGINGGGEPRTRLLQSGREGAFRRKDRVRADDDRHHLAGALRLAQNDAPEPSSARVGVVGAELEALEELRERRCRLVGAVGAQRAALRRHHAAACGTVDAADDPLTLRFVDELRLVAVAGCFRRGCDRLDPTELRKVLSANILFVSQLFAVVEVVQLTGAAFLRVGTKNRIFHNI